MFYRIRKTDFEGSVSYSGKISAKIESFDQLGYTVYPNPNSGAFSITLDDYQEAIQVVLVSQSGMIFYSNKIELGGTSKTIFFDLQQSLSDGIYFLRISSGNHSGAKQIIVSNSTARMN